MAQHALVTAAFASFVGSVLANVVLATSAEPLAEMSLKFGPPEYFWLGIFGLTIISVLSSGNLLKGFIAAAIGLLFSSVGMATLSGDVRLTFGYPELQGGIGLAGALIGFFCLPEILSNVIGRRREHYAGAAVRPSVSVIVETISDLVRRPVLMVRSSLIGLVVGVAPGAGGNIASMVSYSEATRWERDGDEFGKGTIRGVAASEAANSAMAPGSLIPLLTLGIPGSPPAAVILGALMLHGMQPGVELFAAHSSVVYAFIAGLAVAAFAVLLLGTLGSFVYARIVNIPSRALAPAILVLARAGRLRHPQQHARRLGHADVRRDRVRADPAELPSGAPGPRLHPRSLHRERHRAVDDARRRIGERAGLHDAPPDQHRPDRAVRAVRLMAAAERTGPTPPAASRSGARPRYRRRHGPRDADPRPRCRCQYGPRDRVRHHRGGGRRVHEHAGAQPVRGAVRGALCGRACDPGPWRRSSRGSSGRNAAPSSSRRPSAGA